MSFQKDRLDSIITVPVVASNDLIERSLPACVLDVKEAELGVELAVARRGEIRAEDYRFVPADVRKPIDARVRRPRFGDEIGFRCWLGYRLAIRSSRALRERN